MSEPRKTTMSPSPQAESGPESGPEPGADSDQAQATLAPSLDDEASVSQSDEVPESADVPNDQDQHNEEEGSTLLSDLHRAAEEHQTTFTFLFNHTQNMLAGPDREHLPREVINDMQDLCLQQVRWREVWLKKIELLRRKEEMDKDKAIIQVMMDRLLEKHAEWAKENEELKKKEQALEIERDGIRDRLAALGPVGNVDWKEALQKYSEMLGISMVDGNED